MNETLHERVRRLRERALVRGWEYRQRGQAKGAWHRLRRALVDASQAWIIDDLDAERVQSEGCLPLPVGREFAPPKRVFFLTPEKLFRLPSRRQVPVRLGSELIQARNLVFVPHDEQPGP